MIDEHILQIQESFESDEAIKRYEFNEYAPQTGTNLNSPGEIRIIIESQDEFFHLSNSYILIEGDLLKEAKDGADFLYKNEDNIALSNNGPLYLFSNIRLEMSGTEIESLNYPGPATTMKGLLKYSNDFSQNQGLNQCWIKDSEDGAASVTTNPGFKTRQSYIIKSPAPKGSFGFAIPLSHIFGYAEDYKKVTYGFRHILTLVRQKNDDAIFRDATAKIGKVQLTKVSWYTPRVLPNDKMKLSLMKMIEDRKTLSVGFRQHQCDTITVDKSTSFSWKLSCRTSPECPRWVIIGFQSDRAGDQLKNAALFDNCNAENVWIELNGISYPSLPLNIDYTKRRIAGAYKTITDFITNYYGIPENQSSISVTEYSTLFSLHIIDLTKQPERIKLGVMDLTVRATFRAAIDKTTQAFALVLSDRILKFESDGNKMHVIY